MPANVVHRVNLPVVAARAMMLSSPISGAGSRQIVEFRSREAHKSAFEN